MNIAAADIKQAILDGDDFGHEMRVSDIFSKKTLVARGSNSNNPEFKIIGHGGSYIDSNTGKPRQFDFRFQIDRYDQTPSNVNYVFLAVEGKNLYRELPLVICGRPRTNDEAYHVRIRSEERRVGKGGRS